MNRPTQALLALCIVPLCVASGALAQEDKWGDKPVDLKGLIAPVRPLVPVPLPRDYQFNSGSRLRFNGPDLVCVRGFPS